MVSSFDPAFVVSSATDEGPGVGKVIVNTIPLLRDFCSKRSHVVRSSEGLGRWATVQSPRRSQPAQPKSAGSQGRSPSAEENASQETVTDTWPQTKQTRRGGEASLQLMNKEGTRLSSRSRPHGQGRSLTPGPSHQDRTSGLSSLCFRAGLSQCRPRCRLPVLPPEQ